ncbi:hypothetical protein HBI52_211710 [Parastagonospora nodorum]|nr:hypothetical protein HBI52_211710 [Parastagonospora nodorum]
MPSVTFISNVYIANSLRARILINLSAVLYNLSAKVSIIDLNFVPSITFNAIRNVELTGNLLDNADRINNNNNNERTASLAKRIKTNKNCKKSTHRQEFNSSSSLKLQKISDNNNIQLVRDNIEELIYISKVKNNYNNLNIIVTNPTSREFSRVDIKSSTRLYLLIDRAKAYNISKFYKSKNIQLLRPVFKLQRYDYYNLQDIITLRLRNNSYKFYRLVITSKNTHYKQIIKKAYIILPERASLILFII